MTIKLPKSILKEYPKNTACIRYELNGEEKDWFIGAVPDRDNGNTLREHLEKWIPKAKLIAWCVK